MATPERLDKDKEPLVNDAMKVCQFLQNEGVMQQLIQAISASSSTDLNLFDLGLIWKKKILELQRTNPQKYFKDLQKAVGRDLSIITFVLPELQQNLQNCISSQQNKEINSGLEMALEQVKEEIPEPELIIKETCSLNDQQTEPCRVSPPPNVSGGNDKSPEVDPNPVAVASLAVSVDAKNDQLSDRDYAKVVMDVVEREYHFPKIGDDDEPELPPAKKVCLSKAEDQTLAKGNKSSSANANANKTSYAAVTKGMSECEPKLEIVSHHTEASTRRAEWTNCEKILLESFSLMSSRQRLIFLLLLQRSRRRHPEENESSSSDSE